MKLTAHLYDFQSGGSLEEAMRYAIFASAVYEKPKDRGSFLKKYNKGTHFIVPKYSNEEVLVTKHTKTKEVIISLRGSQTLEDWVITDWALVKNKIEGTRRFNKNTKLLDSLFSSEKLMDTMARLARLRSFSNILIAFTATLMES